MQRNFMSMLRAKWQEGKYVCVGLDIDYLKLSVGFLNRYKEASRSRAMEIFNEKIIDQTRDIVCAYKPNIAFYEAIGEPGFELLDHTIRYIKETAPTVPIILDAKRADIGKTNESYVHAILSKEWGFGADAVTVHPYLGSEAMKPFLDQKDKGIIVLCKTSNPGAGEFQDLPVQYDGEEMPLYQYVARTVLEKWNYNGNCLLVAGATYPEELARIRAIVGTMPILIPGIGTQGGDIEKTVAAGLDDDGGGIIINSSSAIIYADNPRMATLELDAAVRKAMSTVLCDRHG